MAAKAALLGLWRHDDQASERRVSGQLRAGVHGQHHAAVIDSGGFPLLAARSEAA